MKKILLCLALPLSMVSVAHAETVHLDDDIGCDSTNVQHMRIQLTRIIMNSDNELARDQANRQIVELTGKHCINLSGIFTIQAREQGLLKVMKADGTPFWLVQ